MKSLVGESTPHHPNPQISPMVSVQRRGVIKRHRGGQFLAAIPPQPGAARGSPLRLGVVVGRRVSTLSTHARSPPLAALSSFYEAPPT
jgi:hypothetical protein